MFSLSDSLMEHLAQTRVKDTQKYLKMFSVLNAREEETCKISQVVNTKYKCEWKYKFKAMWSFLTHLQHLVQSQKQTSTWHDKNLMSQTLNIFSSHTLSSDRKFIFNDIEDGIYLRHSSLTKSASSLKTNMKTFQV